jgi:hypothetical protein
MRGARQNGKTVDVGQARHPVWILLPCAVGLAFLGLNGCQTSSDTRTAVADPLKGEKQPEKTAIGPQMPPQNRAGMTPPQPSTIASKSNAALLDPDPLVGGRPPLAIPDPRKQQAPMLPAGGWQAKPDGSLTGGQNGPPVVLRLPVATDAPTPPGPVPESNSPPPPLPDSSPENAQLQAALKQRGVLWQDQKYVAGGIRFTCAVANPQDASFSRVYEATAPELHSAITSVLEQIDQHR